MSDELLSLFELSEVEDCIMCEFDIRVIFENAAIKKDLREKLEKDATFLYRKLSYVDHVSVFGSEFSMKYKLFGSMKLCEGFAYLFFNRFPAEFKKGDLIGGRKLS